MNGSRHSLIVIGHKNPDTDSICAAISYAGFKNEVAGEAAAPYRAGNINTQTRFVLSHFGVTDPPLLTDVYSKIADIMIPRKDCIALTEEDSIDKASGIITSRAFTFLPVIDRAERCIGRITAHRLAGLLKDIANRACVEPVSESARDYLTRPIRDLVDREHTVFKPSDLVRDVQRLISGRNEGGFIIVDDDMKLEGVITRVNFLSESRLRVAMVDHNELSQAVDGMEEAEIVEIIDHHRLGNKMTSAPITFINRTVGSTSTIVADLYRTAGAVPRKEHAGIMLSALLSDTVILRSPTTTEIDKQVAQWLAGVCGEGIEEYGEKMFSAGSAVAGMSAADIVGQDRKPYAEGERKFSVSQLETVGFGGLLERTGELFAELERIREREGLSLACLMVTDVTRETSLLLCRGEPRILGLITYPRREEGIYEMKGVLSRKKQVLPYIVDLLRKV
jgi:manganese-dependent inorganic pyrophosphatase